MSPYNIFFIRIQELDGYREQFEEFMKQYTDRWLGVRHSGKNKMNLHWHFVVHTQLKHKDLRNRIVKHFTKAKGNKHCSIKSSDGDVKNYSYMFKEHERDTFAVMQDGSYKENDIKKFVEKHEEVNDEIKAKCPNAMCNAVYDILLKKGLNEPSDEQIFMEIFKWYKANGDWFPNKYQSERYILKIQSMFRQDPEQFDNWAREIYRGWFRNF